MPVFRVTRTSVITETRLVSAPSPAEARERYECAGLVETRTEVVAVPEAWDVERAARPLGATALRVLDEVAA